MSGANLPQGSKGAGLSTGQFTGQSNGQSAVNKRTTQELPMEVDSESVSSAELQVDSTPDTKDAEKTSKNCDSKSSRRPTHKTPRVPRSVSLEKLTPRDQKLSERGRRSHSEEMTSSTYLSSRASSRKTKRKKSAEWVDVFTPSQYSGGSSHGSSLSVGSSASESANQRAGSLDPSHEIFAKSLRQSLGDESNLHNHLSSSEKECGVFNRRHTHSEQGMDVTAQGRSSRERSLSREGTMSPCEPQISSKVPSKVNNKQTKYSKETDQIKLKSVLSKRAAPNQKEISSTKSVSTHENNTSRKPTGAKRRIDDASRTVLPSIDNNRNHVSGNSGKPTRQSKTTKQKLKTDAATRKMKSKLTTRKSPKQLEQCFVVDKLPDGRRQSLEFGDVVDIEEVLEGMVDHVAHQEKMQNRQKLISNDQSEEMSYEVSDYSSDSLDGAEDDGELMGPDIAGTSGTMGPSMEGTSATMGPSITGTSGAMRLPHVPLSQSLILDEQAKIQRHLSFLYQRESSSEKSYSQDSLNKSAEDLLTSDRHLTSGLSKSHLGCLDPSAGMRADSLHNPSRKSSSGSQHQAAVTSEESDVPPDVIGRVDVGVQGEDVGEDEEKDDDRQGGVLRESVSAATQSESDALYSLDSLLEQQERLQALEEVIQQMAAR